MSCFRDVVILAFMGAGCKSSIRIMILAFTSSASRLPRYQVSLGIMDCNSTLLPSDILALIPRLGNWGLYRCRESRNPRSYCSSHCIASLWTRDCTGVNCDFRAWTQIRVAFTELNDAMKNKFTEFIRSMDRTSFGSFVLI